MHNDQLTGDGLANVLEGLTGNDTLIGGGGNDTLYGGLGDDSLEGGIGADVFKWNLADQGLTATPAIDRIKDFTPGTSGDVLDLRDLLNFEHSTTGPAYNLGEYLRFGVSADSKLLLEIDHDGLREGGSSFAVDQKIVFENFADRAALAAALGVADTDTAVINKLIANGNLKVDI